MASTFYAAAGDKYQTTKRERYQALQTRLWSDRASFDSHWRELGDFLLPRRTRFWPGDRNRGDKRNQNIIDSTGRFAARTLASGLHAGLTSPARPWMKLTTPDPDLATAKPVQVWLEEVRKRMMVIFADTNLYNMLPIVYGDMGVFGTAAMGILPDAKDLFRAYTYPIGSYALALDARGLATTFIRKYELTCRQIVEEFGVRRGYRDIDWTTISSAVKNAWDRSNYEAAFELCWLVMPNEEVDPRRLEAKYLPWTSCHFELGSDELVRAERKFLRESGFKSFPIMAPRWDITADDAYGTDCPGMTALGDVKQLQIMQRRKGQAIAKMVDPPLVGSPELRSQKTSLLPADVTYVRDPANGLRAIHEVTLNIEHLARDLGDTQYRIQRAFYEDLFLMLARSDDRLGADRPTAREIEERHEEKLIALGPVLERTNDELLDPLVDRVFELMVDAGLIPEAPEDLSGVNLKVEYISILQQAQKLVSVSGQDRFVQSIGSMVEVFPEVRHKINAYRIVDTYQDMLGVDPELVRSDDEADELAGAEAQQAQQAQAAANAMAMAKAAKDASQAPVGRDSVLDRVAQGAAAGAGA